MINLTNGSVRIYICKTAADMRKSFEGLSFMVRDVINADPISGHLFVFFNRVRDKVKILYFDRSGFALWYKELQRGTFSHPQKEEVTHAELICILEGIELESIRRKKIYNHHESLGVTNV